jgi:YD repeat-containing protein
VQSISWSSTTYCGAYRQNAQLGISTLYGFAQYNESGGLNNYTYNSYGELTSAGNPENDAVLTYHNDEAFGTSAITGGFACPSSVPGSDIAVADCLQVVDLDQRIITFAFDGDGGTLGVYDPAGDLYQVGVTSTLNWITNPLTSIDSVFTSFYYTSGDASPYTDDLYSIWSPNQQGTTTPSDVFAYNTTGMATEVSTPGYPSTFNTTYTYGTTGCPSACLGTGDTQSTIVTYPDGDQEFDDFAQGLMTSKDLGYGSASPEQWTYTHNSLDDPTDETITEPMGRTSNIVTDVYGNDLAVIDGEGHTTSSAYNSYGEACWSAPVATSSTSCSDPPADATVNTYDAYGNLLSSVDPLGNHTTHSYDGYGELTSTTDPDGDTTTYTYFGSNSSELESSTDPLGGETTYVYYPDGWVSGSVSQLGNVSGGTPSNYTTNYAYNESGWLTSETTPGSRTTVNVYDADGNLLKTTDPAGYVNSYGYDADDRQCWSLKGANTTATCGSPPSDATVTTDYYDTTNPATVDDTSSGVETEYSYSAKAPISAGLHPDTQIVSHSQFRPMSPSVKMFRFAQPDLRSGHRTRLLRVSQFAW